MKNGSEKMSLSCVPRLNLRRWVGRRPKRKWEVTSYKKEASQDNPNRREISANKSFQKIPQNSKRGLMDTNWGPHKLKGIAFLNPEEGFWKKTIIRVPNEGSLKKRMGTNSSMG